MTFDGFSLFKEFEILVSEILKNNGFDVKDVSTTRDKGFDLEIELEGKKAIVEIKLQRSKSARIDLVKRACQQLLFAHKKNKNALPILIISSYVKNEFKNEMLSTYGILIWDIRELFSLAFNFSELYYKLEELLYKTFGSSVEEYSVINKDEASKIIPDFKKITTTEKDEVIVELRGKNLCTELTEIKAGKRAFRKYEDKSIEILKYLFEKDLELWKDQNQTDDKLHRLDLLCRLRPSSKNFWEELLNDFNSRYVVFEFKNYKEKIKQGQIYTTEKYLFRTALRSIAFIIAKNDGDKNAYKAASGALKEAGKLIVILSSKDVCNMLEMKDAGNEPTELLREKIDELLIGMSR